MLNVPEWLTRRAGELKPAPEGKSWFVMLDGEPQYTLVPRPVAGKFGCLIMHTNSGQPIASTSTAADAEKALTEGLEDLRKYLGW